MFRGMMPVEYKREIEECGLVTAGLLAVIGIGLVLSTVL